MKGLRMRSRVTSVLEAAGLACVAAGVWLHFGVWAGLLVGGAELVAVGVLQG